LWHRPQSPSNSRTSLLESSIYVTTSSIEYVWTTTPSDIWTRFGCNTSIMPRLYDSARVLLITSAFAFRKDHGLWWVYAILSLLLCNVYKQYRSNKNSSRDPGFAIIFWFIPLHEPIISFSPFTLLLFQLYVLPSTYNLPFAYLYGSP
jgi:hypothetical protein